MFTIITEKDHQSVKLNIFIVTVTRINLLNNHTDLFNKSVHGRVGQRENILVIIVVILFLLFSRDYWNNQTKHLELSIISSPFNFSTSEMWSSFYKGYSIEVRISLCYYFSEQHMILFIILQYHCFVHYLCYNLIKELLSGFVKNFLILDVAEKDNHYQCFFLRLSFLIKSYYMSHRTPRIIYLHNKIND